MATHPRVCSPLERAGPARAIYDAAMKLAASLFLGAFLGLLCASCDGAETGHHTDAGTRDGAPLGTSPVYGPCVDERDCNRIDAECLADGTTGDAFCTIACDGPDGCPSGGTCDAMGIGSYCVAD